MQVLQVQSQITFNEVLLKDGVMMLMYVALCTGLSASRAGYLAEAITDAITVTSNISL
jgi:hypothetical protein